MTRRSPLIALAITIAVTLAICGTTRLISMSYADGASSVMDDAMESGDAGVITVRTAPDLSKDPVASYRAVRDQAERVSLFSAAVLVLYLLSSALLRHFRPGAWLYSGPRLAYLTSAVGILGVTLDATVGAGSWSSVAAFGLTTIALVISHPPKGESTPAMQPEPPK